MPLQIITNITWEKFFCVEKDCWIARIMSGYKDFGHLKAGDVSEDPKGTYAWFEWEGASSKLATNAGGRQSSAIARAMNFPKNFGLKQTKLTLVTLE